MQTLWAPWRMDYIKTVSDGPKECFLCQTAKDPDHDTDHLVIVRSAHCVLMMNRFPYVNGHLLVAPYKHVAELEELDTVERAEIMELLAYGQVLLKKTMNPQGFNLGFNIGRCAGAGVPGHVHGHIVPRWSGDINFMSVVGEVKIIPQSVETAYSLLRDAHAQEQTQTASSA